MRFKKYRYKIFFSICRMFRQNEGESLTWYLSVIHFILFPLERILNKIRNSGSFYCDYATLSVVVMGEKIPMKLMVDIIGSGKVVFTKNSIGEILSDVGVPVYVRKMVMKKVEERCGS